MRRRRRRRRRRRENKKLFICSDFLAETGAPNENIVQNHLNIELLNVF